MNNKGQTLIIFVILIPIFILIMAFVVDTGIMLKEYTRLNSTTRTVLKTIPQNTPDYETKVKKLLEKNNIPTKNIKIVKKEEDVKITNSYKIESIFGKIIGIKNYKIKINIQINKNNDIIIKE